MVGDLVALLLGGDPRRLLQGALQLVGGVKVLDGPAGAADDVVMMPGELLGQLESPVVVGPGDAAEHAEVDEGGDVPVGAALGQLGRRGEDLGDRERSTGPGEAAAR